MLPLLFLLLFFLLLLLLLLLLLFFGGGLASSYFSYQLAMQPKFLLNLGEGCSFFPTELTN